MGKRSLSVVLYSMLLVFYIVIVMYVFKEILHADELENFFVALVFEIIGFILLAYFVIGQLALAPVKIGFFPSLLIATLVYVVLLNALNLLFILFVPKTYLVLSNLILLFIYFLVSVPIYIMGKK